MKISTYLVLILLSIIIYFLPNKQEKTINFNNSNYKIILNVGIKKSYFTKNYAGILFFNEKFINLNLNSINDNLEIGCDEKYFWYISSYDPILYYGNINDVDYILKEIFNPKNLIQIIKPEDNQYSQGNFGKKLEKKTKFEKDKITTQSVYDNDELIYECHYRDYSQNVAKKIKVYYPKEKVEISLFLKDISTIDFFDYSIPFEKFKENQLIVK